MNKPFDDFKKRFKLLSQKKPHLIINTLSNIFSMRLIGNKTHGDLAEVGFAEFINQFMYDFRSEHVGKNLFRSKSREEDILVFNEITQSQFPVSLKAYGIGPLQLSTDKNEKMFPLLNKQGRCIKSKKDINAIWVSKEFSYLSTINALPLIYNEKEKKCNIMVFDFEKAKRQTRKILYVDKNQSYDEQKGRVVKRRGRAHPIFLFLGKNDEYICEVRYGGKTANALQRGFWTHTEKAANYFDSLTNGWIDYSHNETLVRLFRLALNSSEQGHQSANVILQKDIERLKKL